MQERDETEEVVEEKMEEIALGAKGGGNNDDTRRKQQRHEEMDETAAEVKVVLLQLCKGYNSNRKLQIAAAYLKTIFYFFYHLNMYWLINTSPTVFLNFGFTYMKI